MPRASFADLGALLWILTAALGTLAGLSPRLSFSGEIEQREGLLTVLALGGLWFGARRSHATLEDHHGTLDVLLWSATLAAAYAMVQLAGFDPLGWAHIATYPSVSGAVLRPFGTLGSATLLGALLAPALALGVTRLAVGRGDAWRLAPITALLSVAILATLSRGAWLAAAAGALVAVAGVIAACGPRRTPRAALALGSAALPAALWAAFVLRAPLAGRLAEGAHATSAPARAEIARAALALTRAHPWLGTGPDTFGLAFPAVQSPAYWRTEWLGMPVHAHSAALQILATGGALAALAGLLWLSGTTLALVRAWRTELGARGEILAIGAALASLVVAGALNVVGLAGAAAFVTLSALAANVGAARTALPAEPAGRRSPIAAVLVALAIAAAVGVASWGEFRALAAAGRARATLDKMAGQSGEVRAAAAERAWREAEAGAARAPREDELQRLAADAALARGEGALIRNASDVADSSARDAERHARLAVSLEPHRATNHDRLANSLAMRARVDRSAALADSAWAAFAEARRLAPADGLILVDEARAALALGAMPRALESASRITALYPEAATGHALAAAAWLGMGKREEPRAALRRALAARWEEGEEPARRAAADLLRALEREPR